VRLAILSDIHEDYLNLKEMVRVAEAKGFDKLVCLGDISGFSLPYYDYEEDRNAPACLALMREKCDLIIAGNHDYHAAGIVPDIPDLLQDMDPWPHEQDMDPGYSDEEISFLSSLPSHVILPSPVGNILLSHYVYPNLSGFMKGFYEGAKDFDKHFEFMRELACSLCFIGHSHPWGAYTVYPTGLKHIPNRHFKIRTIPTIIGIPSVTRNGHRSSFCIFDTESRRLKVLR
jgi:predicted phosphodiesterase